MLHHLKPVCGEIFQYECEPNATVRGHASSAVGNVVGSNIFNVLFVLGGVATIRRVPGALIAFESV
jgi:hypothetical protein